jgi:serine/threonine-protein kinase HipA
MSINHIISVYFQGEEIGKLAVDENGGRSFFQYHDAFLNQGKWSHLIPIEIKRIKQTQVFSRNNNDTFRGLPAVFADSLPDLFGNIIFKTWIENSNRDLTKITALEQLAYVGTRGMGALEYQPVKITNTSDQINIDEIVAIVKKVLIQKESNQGYKLDHASLLTLFKLGSSAGGARPKILIAENKQTGTIIPGDIVISEDYHHYLVKLNIDEQLSYSREKLEYCYYLTAREAGIEMMDSKMIDDKHFATLRYDRVQGRKIHTLTATGLTGFDYKEPLHSTYENLFKLLVRLRCPHKDSEQLFRRMVFNLVFANHDDHLKNHSFIYNDYTDTWQLAPAYDITYSLNADLHFKTKSRALAVNGKRNEITLADLEVIADAFTISNYKGIIADVVDCVGYFREVAKENGVSERVIDRMGKSFNFF